MPGLVPGIHVFSSFSQDVDGGTSPAMTVPKDVIADN